MPASRARTIASARSRTWSFEKMLDTWLRTVLGDRTRAAVMSAFDRPCAMSSRISCSRSVSSGKAAGSARGAGRAKKSISRRATPGPKIASPAATDRTARINSAREAPLSR